MAAAVSSVTMFTVNSPVDRTLAAVSFSAPFRRPAEKITVGGLADTTLKNEYGATFGVPSPARLPIQPMGLGTTSPVSSL